MASIFLSYAREDSTSAALIAQALFAQGWTVWWDRTIPPGRTFDDVIEDALDDAACVVVLWSKASSNSHWVRAEAAEGMRRGILVPAFLESVKIPLEFRRIQAANLTSWNGNADDPAFEQFLQSVASLVQSTTVGPTPVASQRDSELSLDLFDRPASDVLQQPLAPRGRPTLIRWTLSVAAAVVVVIAALVAWRIASSSRSNVADAGAKPVTATPAPVATTPTEPVAPIDSLREVPSLVGRSLVEARSQVERIGLVVGTIRETSQGGTAGAITAQRPVAGERVGPGTAIDLVITTASLPKPEKVERPATSKVEARLPQQVEVPSLTGLSVDVARDRLVRRGLSVGSVSVRRASRSEVDVVLAQDPVAGARRPRETPVSLVIGGEP